MCSAHVCYGSSLASPCFLPYSPAPLCSFPSPLPSQPPPVPSLPSSSSSIQLSILRKTPVKILGLSQTTGVVPWTVSLYKRTRGLHFSLDNMILELSYLSLYESLLDRMKWETFLYHIYIIYHSCIRQEGNSHQWYLWSRIFLYKCKFLENTIGTQEVCRCVNIHTARYLSLSPFSSLSQRHLGFLPSSQLIFLFLSSVFQKETPFCLPSCVFEPRDLKTTVYIVLVTF